MSSTRRLLVTDLDNTLWDWFGAWHASFSALLDQLTSDTGLPQELLEQEIRLVHQRHGTSEYSLLLDELPSLIKLSVDESPRQVFDKALHAQNSARLKHTTLYPGVRETLVELRERGVTIVAYTESIAYWTGWRIKHTELDGVIDILYSAPDHDFPDGVAPSDIRFHADEEYGLKVTDHRHVARGAVKPNADILRSILSAVGVSPSETVYVGDSMMKDVAMAQAAGVLDAHAKYGEAQHLSDYALLQRVSHWPDAAVTKEQQLRTSMEVVPTVSLDEGFFQVSELLA